MRLDAFLCEKGLAKSRTFAKTLIEGGYVEVNGKTAKKPAVDVSDGDSVKVTGTPYEYVSRGGVKLAAALDSFGVYPKDMICVDIGASCGGFTDCLLRRGAEKVYAVDSGTDQLDEKLKCDSRVVSMEGFNARELDREILGQVCDMAVADVSFISQTLIIPAVPRVLRNDGIYIFLIKPQFECGRSALSKGGIVKDKKQQAAAVCRTIQCAEKNGMGALGLIKSPVTGGDGNTEYLAYCRMGSPGTVNDETVKKVCGI